MQLDIPCLVVIPGRPAIFWGNEEEWIRGRGRGVSWGGDREGRRVEELLLGCNIRYKKKQKCTS